MNDEGRASGRSATFLHSLLLNLLDESASHLIIPVLINHPLDPGRRSFRSMISVKLRDCNQRSTTYLDVDRDQILTLRRPNERALHQIMLALVEATPAVDLASLLP